MSIYVLGRDVTKVSSLNSDRIISVKSDICDNNALNKALRNIAEIDVFVNTIGSFTKGVVRNNSNTTVEKHFELNAIANIRLTNIILPKLNTKFAQILICLATLSIVPRVSYSLQAASKSAYKAYIDTLRLEEETIRIMTIHPSSLDTDVFAKGGDKRDSNKYPSPSVIANIMKFMLEQPKTIEISEIIVYNRTYRELKIEMRKDES